MTGPGQAGRWIGALTAGRRFAVLTVISAVLIATAALLGGQAMVAAAALVGFGAIGLLGLVPGELSDLRRGAADERQQLMIVESFAISGYVIRPAIFVGVLVEGYRGHPGPFMGIAAVASIAEIGALLVLPRRR